MNYTNKFYYLAKVIMSCTTDEQLDVCKLWIRNRELEIDDYFQLMGLIIDKSKGFN